MTEITTTGTVVNAESVTISGNVKRCGNCHETKLLIRAQVHGPALLVCATCGATAGQVSK